MKKTSILVTLFYSFILISCNNKSTEKSTDDKEKELLKKELELTKKELELNKKESEVQTKKESKPKKQEGPVTTEDQIEVIKTDTQDDPIKIMQIIFDAAKTNDFSKLSGLCDPTGSGDRDTKSICNVGTQSQKAQNEFREFFQNGQVIGTALIGDNTASVRFKFGPNGRTREEEMNFTKVDGKWYLSGF